MQNQIVIINNNNKFQSWRSINRSIKKVQIDKKSGKFVSNILFRDIFN